MPSCNMQIVKGMGLTVRDMKTISSYMCSVRYLKKIVPLTVYNIIYNRVNFDASYFVDRTVCGISFKMFKSGTKDHVLAETFYCCKGAVECIEKEYLKEMHLLFHDKRTNAIFEDYKFSFGYDKEPNPTTLPKSEDVINITKQLFESIQALARYNKLQDDIDISLELVFGDQVPEIYNPAYFIQPTTTPLILQLPHQMDVYTTIANVKTGFHKLKCAVNNSAFVAKESPGSSIVMTDNDSNKVLIENQSNTEDIQANSIEDVADEDQDLLANNTSEAEIIINVEDLISISSNKYPEELDADNFHCPCGISGPIELLEDIKCSVCTKYQHLPCVGYQNVDSIDPVYICVYCGTIDNNPSDKLLTEKSNNSRQLFCCTRAVAHFAYTYRKAPLELLEKMDLGVRGKVLDMFKQGKIMKINPTKNSVTLKENVTVLLSKIFYDFRLPQSMDLDEDDMEVLDI